MEHAKLMVHAGGVRVTREDLVKFETPAATATWKPLPHHVLVDVIHAEVARRQIAVVQEEYAVQRKTHMLVGTLSSTGSTTTSLRQPWPFVMPTICQRP
jgi:hypothetical protein